MTLPASGRGACSWCGRRRDDRRPVWQTDDTPDLSTTLKEIDRRLATAEEWGRTLRVLDGDRFTMGRWAPILPIPKTRLMAIPAVAISNTPRFGETHG